MRPFPTNLLLAVSVPMALSLGASRVLAQQPEPPPAPSVLVSPGDIPLPEHDEVGADAFWKPDRTGQAAGLSALWWRNDIAFCERRPGVVDPDQHLVMYLPAGFSRSGHGRYPLFLIFHGVGGRHDDPEMLATLRSMARRGYVAVSAGFLEPGLEAQAATLTNGFLDGAKVDTFMQGIADGRCALRFLSALGARPGNPLQIDASKVAVAGFSLGSFISQAVSFIPKQAARICVDGEEHQSTRYRQMMHERLGHGVVHSDTGCSQVKRADWNRVEATLGHTERMWRREGGVESVDALVAISTSAGLLEISTTCTLMHSALGKPGALGAPPPISPRGEPLCGRYKDVSASFAVLDLPQANLIAKAWHFLTLGVMSSTRNSLVDRAVTNHGLGELEVVVPNEFFLDPEVRRAAESWSVPSFRDPDDKLPVLVMAGRDDATAHWYQGASLGAMLRADGLPAETLVFENTPHMWHFDKTPKDAGDGTGGPFFALRNQYIANFTDAVFDDCDVNAWFAEQCAKPLPDGSFHPAAPKCLHQVLAVGRPHIFARSNAAHVTRPHGGDFAVSGLASRVGPMIASRGDARRPEYDEAEGTYHLFSGLDYEFDAIHFERSAAGYVDESKNVRWELQGMGFHGTRANLVTSDGSLAPLVLRFNVGGLPRQTTQGFTLPIGDYVLTAISGDGRTQGHARISADMHPYGEVAGARALEGSALWGLVKWDRVEWDAVATPRRPGGQVDIYLDGQREPTVRAARGNSWTFFHRAATRYRVCFTGTDLCSTDLVPSRL